MHQLKIIKVFLCQCFFKTMIEQILFTMLCSFCHYMRKQKQKTKRVFMITTNTFWLDDCIKCFEQQNHTFSTEEPGDDSAGISTVQQMDKNKLLKLTLNLPSPLRPHIHILKAHMFYTFYTQIIVVFIHPLPLTPHDIYMYTLRVCNVCVYVFLVYIYFSK